MELLTKADIQAAQDRPTVDVDCPEWGGAVRLRMLSGPDRDKWESDNVGTGGPGTLNRVNIRARLVAMSIVDADGNRIYADEDAADLGKKSSHVLDRLFDAAMSLSKLRKKDVEDAAKNSEAVPNGGSSSDSAFPSAVPTPTSCLAS